MNGSSFFSSFNGHGWFTIYLAYAFLLTWNVIAMEAAACYIGECRDPDRDAKIAMNLEGLYGLLIYTLIPIAATIARYASSSLRAKRAASLRPPDDCMKRSTASGSSARSAAACPRKSGVR